MKKSELRTGMFVDTLEDTYVVMLDYLGRGSVILNLSGEGWLKLDDYREDLTIDRSLCTYGQQKYYDINKVRSSEIMSSIVPDEFYVVWERKEGVKEYTIEELIKKVGHEFKIKK